LKNQRQDRHHENTTAKTNQGAESANRKADGKYGKIFDQRKLTGLLALRYTERGGVGGLRFERRYRRRFKSAMIVIKYPMLM
jgi:hypothetical protein